MSWSEDKTANEARKIIGYQTTPYHVYIDQRGCLCASKHSEVTVLFIPGAFPAFSVELISQILQTTNWFIMAESLRHWIANSKGNK